MIPLQGGLGVFTMQEITSLPGLQVMGRQSRVEAFGIYINITQPTAMIIH